MRSSGRSGLPSGQTAGIWCQRRGSWRCRGRPPPTAAAPPTGRGGPQQRLGASRAGHGLQAGRGGAWCGWSCRSAWCSVLRGGSTSLRRAARSPALPCRAVVHICSAVPAADCRNAPASDPSGGGFSDPAHQVRPVRLDRPPGRRRCRRRSYSNSTRPVLAGRGRQPRMPPGQDLQLLGPVSADHVLAVAQLGTVPDPLVQVQDPVGLRCELRIPGEDPRPVPPRPDRVRIQPPPHRRPRHRLHQPLGLAACAARSATDQRDCGTPRSSGGSHAIALTSATTVAGNTRGRPLRLRSARPSMPSSANRFRHRDTTSDVYVQALRDHRVLQPVRGQQHDLGPDHLSVRCRIAAGSAAAAQHGQSPTG